MIAAPIPPAAPAAAQRQAAVRRALVLNRLTIAWNVVEGIVAIGAGLAAGSVSLIGFGLDSGIEVSASVILAWRLHRERGGGCMAADDHRAARAIAVSFAALAGYVAA
ncbi:MAG: cation transporter, partial [Acidimicrobiales bacterium]